MTADLLTGGGVRWTRGRSAGKIAAIKYAAQGWAIVPVYDAPGGRCTCPDGATCRSPGKHPRTAHGPDDATADLTTVTQWWTRWPTSNIGCRPGPLHVVIDIDGAKGEAAAQELGLLSEPTLEVVTARGQHRWYRHPGGIIGNVPLALGLDVRADKGIVLVPPSVHRSGTVYRWRDRRAAVVELPPALVARLRDRAGRGTPAGAVADVIREGQRNATLASVAGSLRHRGLDAATIAAALRAVNLSRCDPPLAEAEVNAIAASVGRYAPAAKRPARPLAGSWSFS